MPDAAAVACYADMSIFAFDCWRHYFFRCCHYTPALSPLFIVDIYARQLPLPLHAIDAVDDI